MLLGSSSAASIPGSRIAKREGAHSSLIVATVDYLQALIDRHVHRIYSFVSDAKRIAKRHFN